MILEGTPPIKVELGKGNIGLDIGTQTIALVADKNCKLYELAPNVQNIENTKRIIQRYLNRSSRLTNPKNYNTDGTIKEGIKHKWNNSKRYTKAKNKLKDLYRKQADVRRQDHNLLVNEIIKRM